MVGSITSHPAYGLLKPLGPVQADNGDAKAHVKTAVAELSDLARNASRPESDDGLDDLLWDTWNALFAVIAETPPEKQDGLVEFVRELRHETVTGADGQVLTVQSDGKVWADLPTLGWVARDIWNFDVRSPDASAEQQARFNNQTAFLARLTALADQKNPQDPFDYSMYALWALRTAFEDTPSQGPADAAAIKNAAVWAHYAGRRLRELSLLGRDLPERTGIGGDRFNNSNVGWKGFNADRLKVWFDGFEAALRSQDIDAEALTWIEFGKELLEPGA